MIAIGTVHIVWFGLDNWRWGWRKPDTLNPHWWQIELGPISIQNRRYGS
jgi:hypothetical protein